MHDQNACTKAAVVCPAKCSTEVDNYECCNANNDLIISPNDDKKVNLLGVQSSQAKNCLVTNIDNQKEKEIKDSKSYEQTGYQYVDGARDEKNHSYTLKNDNKYCVVSCKEDYLMTMPNAKRANAGRYFTFSARVEGVKTCTTNKIDIAQYNTDIEDLIKDLEYAFNQYNKYRVADRAFSGGVDDGDAKGIVPTYDDVVGGCGKCLTRPKALLGLNTNITYTSYKFNRSTIDGLITVTSVTSSKASWNYQSEPVYGSTNTKMHDGGYNGGCGSCGCCGKGCAPGSCHPSSISGRAGSYSNIESSIQSYMKEWKDKYHKLLDILSQLQNQYRKCSDTSWTSTIKYDPDVYYNYGEEYLTKFHKERDNMDKSVVNTSSATYTDKKCYYNNISNNDLNSENCSGTTSLPTSNRIYYVNCKDDGTCTQVIAANMPTTSYARKVSKVTTDYRPSTLFYNIYPSGEITTNKNNPNATPVTNGLPISLKTGHGIYEYSVNIGGKLGELDYKSGTMGRYVGSNSATVDSAKLKYSCAYLVNMGKELATGDIKCNWDCPECISNCVGPNCKDICDNGTCVANCIGLGCIYDSVGSSVIEKSVSLSNIFPSGVKSLNWNNAKGTATIEEIQKFGNKTYEKDPILSVTINRSVANAIKNYNDAHENDGGYSNNTITCSDLNGAKVACYSSFIQDLVDKKYGDAVKTVVNRDKNNYFTKWNGATDSITGPAWK